MFQEKMLMERNRDREEVNRRRLGMDEREGRGAKKSAEGRRRGGYSGWVRNKLLPECLGACAPPLPSHTAPSPATLHLSLPRCPDSARPRPVHHSIPAVNHANILTLGFPVTRLSFSPSIPTPTDHRDALLPRNRADLISPRTPILPLPRALGEGRLLEKDADLWRMKTRAN